MNLLIFVRLAEEEFRLLAELHDQHDSSLMLVRRLTRPLYKLLTCLLAIVFENANSIHAIANHHVDELLVRALVQRAQDPRMALLDAKNGRLEDSLMVLHRLYRLCGQCCYCRLARGVSSHRSIDV